MVVLRQFPVGNVPCYSDHRQRSPRLIPDNRGPEFHGEIAPVLSTVENFAVPAPGGRLPGYLICGRLRRAGRSQNGNVLSKQLLCRVSVCIAKRVVDKEKPVLKVNDGNTVLDGGHGVRHEPELCLGGFAPGDVLDLGEEIRRLLLGVVHE